MFCVICPELWKLSGGKRKVLGFTSKEAAAPLISVAAPVWFWKCLGKIEIFGFFGGNFDSFGKFQKFLKMNYE